VTTQPDAVLASAVDAARAALLVDVVPEHVGDHLEAVVDDVLVVTHSFACLDRAYRGWRWSVTLTRTAGSDDVTVDEIVLLPGADSLLAPEWLPWSDRVRPGDLTPGDLFPSAPDDPRLEPGFTGADALDALDESLTDVVPLRPEQWELGLGRETVLSSYGRGVAADRWFDGDFGPASPMAKAAPAQCRSCGYLLPIGGLTGQAFGVCANEYGADGRVVALGYGCGAHSTVREPDGTGIPVTELAIDELRNELVDLSTVEVVSVSVESESDLSVQEVAESGDVGALFTVAELEPAAGTDEPAAPVELDETDDDDDEAAVVADAIVEGADETDTAAADDFVADGIDVELDLVADELLDLDEDDDLDDDDEDEDEDEDDLDEDEDDEDDDEDEDEDDEDDDDEDEDDEDGAAVDSDLADVDDLEPDEVL
jgi:hypothetical protein